MKPLQKTAKGTFYRVEMKAFLAKVHRDLPPTRMWGYQGKSPGPTFEVERNESVFVVWLNHLPRHHFLPVDTTVHGAGKQVPQVRAVVHLHGGVTPATSDGYPESWFSRNFEVTGPTFVNVVNDYPNIQPATTLWYHDHALGITRLNVYAGLAGFYLIRDPDEQALNLPCGPYEIPLLIQDRSFRTDGALYYPSEPTPPSPQYPHPSVVRMFFGTTNTVNGKVWPYLEVEPRKYRFRILNAANSRFYKISLDSNLAFTVIGTDQGLLRTPIEQTEVELGHAERVDIIIDFSKHTGEWITLQNSSTRNEAPLDPQTTGQIMQFRVTLPLSGVDESQIPLKLTSFHDIPIQLTNRTRYLTLNEVKDRYGRPQMLLTNRTWSAPITEKPHLGDIEIWQYINTTMNAHPMHIHLVRVQVLYRRRFNVEKYKQTGKLLYEGPIIPPEPAERGYKDTVVAPPNMVTGVITRFIPFTGRYIWHCHILEHEDYEMMRPIEVLRELHRH
ncbi:multicopper oxidase domain-containing protein [Hazenella sp. IB182353]|uniref:multicopper oxidase family protein n=1 Tax=Polycladospora coralii TaxID=2771432 RepID=UPI001746848A|nr:multicopper oxidase [Polycladospora coralii]MBS7529641.1 multicopper oxidase domain-containing protein [Polycladospora coralii]